MIALALTLALAQVPDGGQVEFPADAPVLRVWQADGGLVCMDEPTAVYLARKKWAAEQPQGVPTSVAVVTIVGAVLSAAATVLVAWRPWEPKK